MSATTLFVEGLKMRSTAERVLRALADLGGRPQMFQTGNTTDEIARHTGLDEKVVRARLIDLRRLGLVVSENCLLSNLPTERVMRYAHHLTVEGERRARRD